MVPIDDAEKLVEGVDTVRKALRVFAASDKVDLILRIA